MFGLKRKKEFVEVSEEQFREEMKPVSSNVVYAINDYIERHRKEIRGFEFCHEPKRRRAFKIVLANGKNKIWDLRRR